jgi:diguanylate cyclase (GGDEF)-like protein
VPRPRVLHDSGDRVSHSEHTPNTDDLAALSVLEGVGLDLREELLRSGRVTHAAPGEVIIRQGRHNDQMYLVVSGKLGVFLEALDAEPVAVLKAGETVGELSLLDGSPASASVAAVEHTRLLAIDEETFWSLINESHAFAINLLLKLVERLRANNVTVSANVRERRRYERAALFDGLTGIHNRRWLDDTLNRLVRRYHHSGGDLCVALVDIDHFKTFNDRHGHHAGDHVLVTVARVLSRNLRPTDLAARFGGEEFVVIFPETVLDDAANASERVRRATAIERSVLTDGTELPPVTLSIGVAKLKPGQSVPELLVAADQAMYRAKQTGRDRVIVDAP